MGGSSNGPQDILLVGVDSRTDAQGNPLPQEVLEQLHTGGDNPRVLNSDTIILLHVPEGGGGRRRLLDPARQLRRHPRLPPGQDQRRVPGGAGADRRALVGEGVRDRARIDAEAARPAGPR